MSFPAARASPRPGLSTLLPSESAPRTCTPTASCRLGGRSTPLTSVLDCTNTYVAGGWVVDPGPADGCIEHRLERERLLLAALDAGPRSEDELLDRAWHDAAAALRPAAALTLRAHLAKLEAEARLPADVDLRLLA